MMDEINFTLVNGLVFNDSLVNGTPAYYSTYTVVYGIDWLIALQVVQVVLLFFILGWLILRKDLS